MDRMGRCHQFRQCQCLHRQAGLQDAQEMVRNAERALNFPKGSVLVGSTGRIGVTLPMDNVRAASLKRVSIGFNT